MNLTRPSASWLVAAGLLAAAVMSPAFAQWSAPMNGTRCEPNTSAWYPSLTVDSVGTAHASWSHTMSDMTDWIEYACKPEGVDTWTRPVRVSRRSFALTGSVVVIGPGGVPHVVWQSEAQAGFLYVSHKDGDTWTMPQRHEGWNGAGSGMRAEADRFHRIHLTWSDIGNYWIMYSLYDSSGWNAPETVLLDTSPYRFSDPDVAPDRMGWPHIACGRSTVEGYPAVYTRRDQSGWSSVDTLPFWGGPPYSDYTRIAVDSLGEPCVVWEYSRPFHAIACSGNGDTWAQPERLDSLSGYMPVVCVDSWNAVHVVFADNPSGLRERVSYRGRWREDFVVDSFAGWAETAVGALGSMGSGVGSRAHPELRTCGTAVARWGRRASPRPAAVLLPAGRRPARIPSARAPAWRLRSRGPSRCPST